jgi:hypothetical protein
MESKRSRNSRAGARKRLRARTCRPARKPSHALPRKPACVAWGARCMHGRALHACARALRGSGVKSAARWGWSRSMELGWHERRGRCLNVYRGGSAPEWRERWILSLDGHTRLVVVHRRSRRCDRKQGASGRSGTTAARRAQRASSLERHDDAMGDGDMAPLRVGRSGFTHNRHGDMMLTGLRGVVPKRHMPQAAPCMPRRRKVRAPVAELGAERTSVQLVAAASGARSGQATRVTRVAALATF